MEEKNGENKNLREITKEVVNLLAKSNGKELDVIEAEKILNINKRRLCDLLNILEGIGVISKKNKSKIIWKSNMTNEAEADEAHENDEIDKLIHKVDHELEDLMESEIFQEYGWLTDDDISALFSSPGIFFLGPTDIPKEIESTVKINEDKDIKYRFHIKSESGIEANLK